MTTSNTTLSSLPEPPLFVEILREGHPALRRLAFSGTGGGDWPGGPCDCRVSSPGGHVADGCLDLPPATWDGAAYALLRGLSPPSLATLDLWLDAEAPAMPFEAPPDIRLWHHDGRPSEDASWRFERMVADERLLELHALPRERRGGHAVELPWTGGAPLFVSVRRRSYMYRVAGTVLAPSWRVIDDFTLPTAYWSFHRNGLATAASALALHLLTRLEAAARGRRKPEDFEAQLAVGHAAVSLRFLGKEFRTRAVAALGRSASRGLDLQALRWLLRHEGGQAEGADALARLSRRLTTERPFHTEILRLLVERLGVAADHEGPRDNADPAVGRAVSTMSALADATVWSSGTLAYRAERPGSPVPDVEWPEQAGIVSAQKKSPAPATARI